VKPIYKRMLAGMERQAQSKRRRKSDPWWVYIVECADGTYYTGITKNVEQRLEQHNAGRGARYTASRRPVALRYVERCRDRSAALSRECRIKALTRPAKQELFADPPVA
jgi:putative endonuclease